MTKEDQYMTNHFNKGGKLWCYSYNKKKWYPQGVLWTVDEEITDFIYNIPEDQFFEARKAHALGQEIEMYSTIHWKWMIIKDPSWINYCDYRVKK